MKNLPTAAALGLAAVLATLLAACGSTTPSPATVTQPANASVTTATTSSATPTSTSRSSTSSTTKTTTSASVASTATTTSTSTAASTTSTTTTRTQTAPAFVGTNPTSGSASAHDLAAAIGVLARSGYVPVSTSTYRDGDTLRVLIGRRKGAGTSDQRAFFFDQTVYLGTDARAASAQISVLDQSDTQVTLGYAVYRSGGSTPTGARQVRFALDMGQLSALDALPSVAARR
jgi:hypothetical protein